jgi:hypothetical protein
VQRADITQPGIAAPILWQGTPDIAPPGVVYILIDGIHRAVRAYREGQRFYCLILSDEQSRACLIGAPAGVIP